MTNVAGEWPAQPDPGTGLTWYRPARDKGMSIEQWGWTSDPWQAHDDYMCFGCFGHPSRCTCPDGPRFTKGHRGVSVVACEPAETPHLPECPDCGSRRHDCPHRVQSEPTTTEESSMTAFTQPGQDRKTEWSEYPLPPMIPGRWYPSYNGRHQYLLPSPANGGMPVGVSRATTVAKTLDDTYKLEMWAVRRRVESILRLLDAAFAPLGGLTAVLAMAKADAESDADDKRTPVPAHLLRCFELVNQLLDDMPKDDLKSTNATIDLIWNYNGGQDANEFGTAVHEWCGALDMGLIQLWQIPDTFMPWAVAYQHALKRAGLVPVAQYVERTVFNDTNDEAVAGQLDRVYRCVVTGELYGGDLKTSKAENLGFTWMTYAVQLAVYFLAPWLMKLDGSGFEPMPALNRDMALLVHIPSDAPEKSQVIPYSLEAGRRYLQTSITARNHRSQAKYEVPGHTTPIPSPEALQYVEAYQAIQAARSVDDLNRVWEAYQSVWTDELTELGRNATTLFT